MFRKILQKLGLRKEKDYPNRFLKFYYLNQKRLMTERKGSYYQKRKTGICVRCSKQVVPEIIFCSYHQEKQRRYNKLARGKLHGVVDQEKEKKEA